VGTRRSFFFYNMFIFLLHLSLRVFLNKSRPTVASIFKKKKKKAKRKEKERDEDKSRETKFKHTDSHININNKK
jgi:hypothetical protein